MRGPRPLEHRYRLLPDRVGLVEIERYAADVAFEPNIRAADLESDWEANARSNRRGT
jgi:hypothetical protein